MVLGLDLEKRMPAGNCAALAMPVDCGRVAYRMHNHRLEPDAASGAAQACRYTMESSAVPLCATCHWHDYDSWLWRRISARGLRQHLVT